MPSSPSVDPVTLQPGDIAVLFTDGLPDVTSAEGNSFGHDRIIEVVARHRKETAGKIIAALYRAATEFIGSKTLSDDITIVVIKAAPLD